MNITSKFLLWLEKNQPATINQIKAAGFTGIPQRKKLLSDGTIESYDGANEDSAAKYSRTVKTFYRMGSADYEEMFNPQKLTPNAAKDSSKANDLSRFDDLPNAAAVDVKTVAGLCACNVATVWDRVNKGKFPAPIKIGGSTRWNVGVLRKFLMGDAE